MVDCYVLFFVCHEMACCCVSILYGWMVTTMVRRVCTGEGKQPRVTATARTPRFRVGETRGTMDENGRRQFKIDIAREVGCKMGVGGDCIANTEVNEAIATGQSCHPVQP